MKASSLTQILYTTDRTVHVESASHFPDSGMIVVNGEVISYSDRGNNYFTVSERGVGFTFTKNHPAESKVVEYNQTYYLDVLEKQILESVGDDLYFDGNGDMEILPTGDYKFVSGLDALNNRLKLRALSLMGFGADPSFGVKLFDDTATPETIVTSLINSIKEDEAVQSADVEDYSLTADGILMVNVNIVPKGLNSGFNFTFKLNHRDRGV